MKELGLYPQDDHARDVYERASKFIASDVRPGQSEYSNAQCRAADRWAAPGIIEDLKAKAREQGLWSLFFTDPEHGAGLTNLQYAPIAEQTGHVPIAAEVFNCNAPDSGNMDLLHAYGSDEQKSRWLLPLLQGEIRSGFMMTEPEVVSSDATNIRTEEALSLMCQRLATRTAFGSTLATQSVWLERIANARIEIDQARLLTLHAAAAMDQAGSKAAKNLIAMVKVATPRMAQAVVDVAIQAYGAAGLSQDTVLPHLFIAARAIRFADGPDEVHDRAIGKAELAEQSVTP